MKPVNRIAQILAVATDDDHHCWLTPEVDKRLYRASWEAHNAMPIPPGMYVRHICDQPRCVNPFHLTVGDSRMNALDRVNRTLPKVQVRKALSKRKGYLSQAERIDIMTSDTSAYDIACQYGVSERLVNNMRERWNSFTELQKQMAIAKVKDP